MWQKANYMEGEGVCMVRWGEGDGGEDCGEDGQQW